MKLVIRRLILLVFVLRLVTPISAFAQTLGPSDPKVPNVTYIETITFCQSDFNIDVSSDGLTYIIPVSAGYSFEEDNNPGLPLFSYNYAINNSQSFSDVSSTCEKRLIKTNVCLAPNPKYVTNNDTLNEGGFSLPQYVEDVYPDSNCKYISTSQFEEISLLHFLIYPFEYDSATGNLYFIDKINITITTSFDSHLVAKVSNNFDTYTQYIGTPEYVKLVSHNKFKIDEILNGRQVVQYEPQNVDYIIITSDKLKSAFTPLLQWKRTKGVYTEVFTIENTASSFDGADLQEKIKQFIKRKYQENGTKFVLLGGDDTIIPVRYCYAKYQSYEEQIPADNYYVCFGGEFNWDKNGNGIFGEVSDNIDFTQNLDISRLPIRTEAQVNAYITKLLAYEKNPKYQGNILIAGNTLGDYLSVNDKYYEDNRPVSDAEGQGRRLCDLIISPDWDGNITYFFDTYTSLPTGADYNFSQ